MLEIYDVESDAPIHQVTFDCNQTAFEWIGQEAILVSDEKGRLTVF